MGKMNQKRYKTAFFLPFLVFLASCSHNSQIATPAADPGNSVPGQFIVVLNGAPLEAQGSDTQLDIASTALSLGVQNIGELRSIGAFIATGVDAAALARLEADPRVRYVEADRVVTLSGSQSNPTWGLDRSDDRSLPLDKNFTYKATGSGVNAYVVDSGIKTGLSEFGSRLMGGVSAVNDGRGYTDCNGHGTHVAGTLGGKTYGIAKNVKLYAVRVFGCSGNANNSTIISGVDWITFNHVSPAVANLSLESAKSQALDEAVQAAISSGVTVVVAAGNGSSNACNTSPARVISALTVGASTRQDGLWRNTNYGSCLDLFAPGEDVVSAAIGGGSLSASGSSMAAAHVSGVAALILETNRSASPNTVANRIKSAVTKGKLKIPSGKSSPNSLLFTSF